MTSTSLSVVPTVAGLRAAVSAWRAAGERVALVPTMGALHAGHVALVHAARARATRVVVSVFVNPAQFNDPADLERYPRTPEADAEALHTAGADLLFLPSPAEVYPPGFATEVSVSALARRWEGEARPGHFQGVATVVAKLLGMASPDVALFGEKDWQQLAIIRRLARDLDMHVEIAGIETVRAPDGLALSSRNALLGPHDRTAAAALPEIMARAVAALEAGAPAETLAASATELRSAGFTEVDYLALVGADDLEPLPRASRPARLIAAARIGGVRLLDNMPVRPA